MMKVLGLTNNVVKAVESAENSLINNYKDMNPKTNGRKIDEVADNLDEANNYLDYATAFGDNKVKALDKEINQTINKFNENKIVYSVDNAIASNRKWFENDKGLTAKTLKNGLKQVIEVLNNYTKEYKNLAL